MELDNINTYDIGYIEMYPEVQEEQYLIEEDFTYVEGWDESVQGVAARILKEYLQGEEEETLTESDVAILDNLVFAALEVVSQ